MGDGDQNMVIMNRSQGRASDLVAGCCIVRRQSQSFVRSQGIGKIFVKFAKSSLRLWGWTPESSGLRQHPGLVGAADHPTLISEPVDQVEVEVAVELIGERVDFGGCYRQVFRRAGDVTQLGADRR